MTDLMLLPTPRHETVILQNLRRMQRSRGGLEVRSVTLERSVRKLERRLTLSDDYEEEQNLQDILDNLSSMINDLELFRLNLEKEISKVTKGLQDLSTLSATAGEVALGSYMVADTNLSVENLAQTGTYYDQVIETVRSINDEPLNY